MDQLTAFEVMELMDKLESTESILNTKSLTVEGIVNIIFYKAFGLDWELNNIYKELRSIVFNMMFLQESQEYKNYYNLVTL